MPSSKKSPSANIVSLPSRPKSTTYPALLLTQNKHRFFFATIPVDDIFPYCFVARRNEDPIVGFQRALNEERANDIAKYLAAGAGSIPTNIVLSAQPFAEFEYNRKAKTISFKRVQKAFLVLDGQHRLWGYSKCDIRHRVPVSIYEGLDRAVEARLFIDINTNQRGVPAALLLDIKQVAKTENEREANLRTMFDKLGTDASSPLHGKMSPSKSLPGRISRVTFNRALSNALESPLLSSASEEERYKLVLNYISAFDAEMSDKTMLTRSAFFEAIFAVFDELVRDTISRDNDAKKTSIQKTIRPLAKLDYAAAVGSRTKLTTKAITSLFQATMRKSVRLSGDML
jgi:DGQHR domain-containing protein